MLAIALKKKYSTMLVVLHGEYIDVEYLKIISDENINLVRLKGGLIKKLFEFYHVLRNNGIRFIFCYLSSDNIWGAIIGKMAGIKNIIGGVRSSYLPLWKLVLMKIVHHLFQNYTVFNNETGRDIFVRKYYFNHTKAIVIHNCYINVPPKITRNENNLVKILTVGRFVGLKDFDTALASIHNLQEFNKSNIRFKFLIVGYGELEDHIRELVDKLKLNDIVEIIINPKEISDYYKESDIYLSTSKYEGLSNSIMEAMAYCLPVVATNAGDNHFLIKEGLNGFLVDKGDAKMISEKLLQLVISGSLRNRMGASSYEYLNRDFTLDKFSENYYSLIESLKKGA
jgi:glycosyltransferase involved in cell wall biosynthesis